MMLPVLGDRSFFGERKKDDKGASTAFLVVWWLSFKVKLTKAICLTQKTNFLCPNRTFLQAIFHTKPRPRAIGCSATWGGPRQQHSINPCCHSAAPRKEISTGYCGEIL